MGHAGLYIGGGGGEGSSGCGKGFPGNAGWSTTGGAIGGGGGMGFPGKAGWSTTTASMVSTFLAAGATGRAPIPLGPAIAKSSAARLTMSRFLFFLEFVLLSLIDGTRTDS